MDSLAQLEIALRAVNVTLGRIDDTRDEYTRAVSARRDRTVALVGEYSLGVLRDSGDPFILTALDRHCTGVDDFERFFDEIIDPPSQLPHGTPIEAIQNADVDALANKGRADAALKAEIGNVWARLRNRKKGRLAAEHDAALTAVAEGLVAMKQKCAVLTLDRTMHEHALQRAGGSAAPLWISLDVLIQVLAADASGPDIDPAAFAPLMASIIRHQCEPVLTTYNTEDLGLLLDIEERCAALPEESVMRIASIVSRARLSGKPRSDPELQLQVKRAFQSSKLDENAELRQKVNQISADIRTRNTQIANEIARGGRTRQALVEARTRELRREANLRAFWRLIRTILLGCAGGALAYFATRWLLPAGDLASNVSMLITLGTPAAAVMAQIWRSIYPDWRAARLSAELQAMREAEEIEKGEAAPLERQPKLPPEAP
jgi:hypothetical protein